MVGVASATAVTYHCNLVWSSSAPMGIHVGAGFWNLFQCEVAHLAARAPRGCALCRSIFGLFIPLAGDGCAQFPQRCQAGEARIAQLVLGIVEDVIGSRAVVGLRASRSGRSAA
jgi:hypothetical protein